MFPWNIAKSAEAMFSRWAVKRVCKFLLKKKLGHLILGDIDIDQLDIQLTNGTLRLCDLALNVDFLNDKLGEAASLVIKEGSIGSLLVKMPWKGKGCEVEVDELELVLAPLARDKSTAEDESCSTSQDSDNGIHHDLRKLQHEMVDNPVTSASLDVHEGVKTIAKMVKWFLTSFHIRIKNLIVAFDPSSEKDERKIGGHTTLVLRIPEIECGTCVSEDANLNYRGRFESLLGISQLTNFVKFQGAVLELLQMDDINNQASSPCVSGITFGESISDCCPSNATIPILTGKKGGFSGNMRLSIPWKNGSLDIRKVDADVHIDPVELRLQPNTVKWFILSWETYKNLDNDSRSHMHYKPIDSVENNSMSSTLGSSAIATDKVVSERDNYSDKVSSLSGQESVTEDLLPGSHLISDWVPIDFTKDQRDGIGELDFGASVDQFFECFDELRNSQSALGSSGMWNWTCSVFSAITAASNLAAGSLHIPSEQQHVETNIKATIAGISIVFCFHDENHKHCCQTKGDQNCGGDQVHYLGAEFGNMVLALQVCPRDVKFEGTVKYIEVTDYLRDENDAMDFGLGSVSDNIHHLNLFMESLQAEVQAALPTFASSAEDPDLVDSKVLDAADFPFGEVVKIPLLRTSGVTHCQVIVNSTSADGSLTGPASFSLKLPTFLFWVNFQLIDLLLNLLKEVGKCVDMNKFPSEALNEKHASSRESTKRGSRLRVRALSPSESLQGNIVVPNAKVILCFPFDSSENLRGYSLWDQFIALDFFSPSTLNKEITREANPLSYGKPQERHSSTATRSLYLHVGNPNIYLVTSASIDGFGTNSRGLNRQKFFAQNVLSVANRMDGLSLSMLWQEGPVTGPWIAKRAKALATSKESKCSRKFVGKDYEFASVTSTKDLEDLYMRSRQEMILSSAFFIRVNISPVSINLGCSQYITLHCLLDQIINGFARGSHSVVDIREESCLSQASILVECDSVEILINLNAKENIKSSMQSELPGSWHYLKLKVKKFELLSVSNIGGIRDASFFWLAHGEGKLCGSITGVSDELLLISCSNSTMNRGDGEGVNASSSRLAGSDIVHLWDPESAHAFTSVTVRGGTIVAVGGRLDWLDEFISFFSLPPAEVDQAGYSGSQKGDPNASGGASFNLNLVDIGLSYEPRFKNLVVSNEVIDSNYGSSNTKEDICEQYIACLLAASSLNLTNTAVVDSVENDYKIGVQDLGILICAVSEPEKLCGTYSVEYLRRIGFVKVAREAQVEAIFRVNGESGLPWELELSKSHIELETCHDTTSGVIRLASQLQQLFAPDLEETLVHLQTRWNNAQQVQEKDGFYGETGNFSAGASPATSQVGTCVDTESALGVAGLMDEICEDAFHVVGMQTWQSDSSESQLHMLLDEALLGESYLSIDTPEVFSPELSFNGSVPAMESEDIQTSFAQKGYYSELIEGYCLSELGTLSETSVGKLPPCKTRNVGTGDLGRKDSGWYDSSLRIVENHIPEMRKPSLKQFVEGKLPSTNHSGDDDFTKGNGCVIIKNVNVRWRMYGGSDWHKFTKNAEHSINIRGRDSDVCLELALSGMEFKYDVFPVGSICASKLSLSVKDFHLYDKSKDAPWKLVLGYYLSRDHPRESSSKGLKLDLEAVRPDPLSPLEEYRLRIALLPMLLHLHQSHLDFLISFFGPKTLPADQCPGHHQDSCGSVLSATKNNIAEEALLPYFQKFDIWPVLVRVDYSPRHVDLVALGGGKYVELVNLVPWKGVELQLKHVHAVGIYGWSSVCETIIGEWLEDISQNQIHKVLKGLPTIRSLVAVGAGAAKLVTLPVESYRRDGRLLKGMQRGTIAFLRSISLEAIGLGVHLAAGAHDILLQAEYILATVPPSVPSAHQARTKANVRSNQPKDAQQGLQQAYESLSDGLGKTASALVRTPLKRYQRGASVGSALATAVRAVPAAAIAPASACMSAAHYALLGFRNSLDPERKKESMEKYLGPSQPLD